MLTESANLPVKAAAKRLGLSHAGGMRIGAAMSVEERLERIEAILERLASREPARTHYSTKEFAGEVKRSEFQVRQWCNRGRIRAEKSLTRTGPSSAWVISHEELERYRREGLLPEDPRRNNPDRGRAA